MRRRTFVAVVGAAAVGPLATRAQQPGRVHRIGVLRVGQFPSGFIEPFRFRMRALGHIEGQNLIIEYGLAASAADLPDVAADLVRRRVEVIVASGTPSVLPAKNATSAIPVVFVAALDPVATGVATSLARPGGNVTGVSAVHTDVTGKRLELLRELLPKLAKVALLVRTTSPATSQYVQQAELAAQTLGMKLQILGVRDPADFEEVFGSAHAADALIQVDDAVFTAHRSRLAELALKYRLPSISGLREMADAGGLMAYGPNYGDLYRSAAVQVHEILKGAKPADLPIEQPTTFELIINLKTARLLSLTIPPAILARADEVIE